MRDTEGYIPLVAECQRLHRRSKGKAEKKKFNARTTKRETTIILRQNKTTTTTTTTTACECRVRIDHTALSVLALFSLSLSETGTDTDQGVSN